MITNDDFFQRINNLEQAVSILKEQSMEYQSAAESNEKKDAKKTYKDRLFKFIFGNPENRAWTLSLYNAVNNTSYQDPSSIQFNTIGDAVYMRMKNDVSFIIASEMNLWEHQSTYNPNMPMRFFLYAGRLYEKYISTSDYYIYSSSLQPVPKPVCICFYNGRQDQPESQVLKLSDAWNGDGDIEVRVTMLNINFGKNQKLMEACEPLHEYAWLVDTVRRYQNEKMDLDAAVDATIDEMPDSYVIKKFLVENRAEVKSMFLTEYNEEKVLEKEREEGRQEGRREGADENNRKNAKAMKNKGFSLQDIADITGLSLEKIAAL